MFEQVRKYVIWVNKNPKTAMEMAKQSQNIFRKSLLLSRQISKTLGEASSANALYLAEFRRFEISRQKIEDGFQEKEWIPLARQDRELIPHAIGKLLLSLTDLDESIDVVTAPWIASSPQGAAKLLLHSDSTCPFCKLDIGNANTLVRNRGVLLSKNAMLHAKIYSSEPFLYHECKNWLNSKGDVFDYDSDLKKIGLQIRSKNSLIPVVVDGNDVNPVGINRKSRKGRRFLKISKKSRLYKALSRWAKKLKRDSWRRRFLIWCYIKFFSLPEEL